MPSRMDTGLFDHCVMHRLPHGILFHPAPAFRPAQDRPLVAIVSHLELFPALHGFRVAVLQLAEFLKAAGYGTIWVNQARADREFISNQQATIDRYFDATLHITRQTPATGAAKGDCVAVETAWCLRWLEDRLGLHAAVAEYAYMAPCLSALSARTLKLVQTIDVVSRLSVDDLRGHGIDFKRGLAEKEERALLQHADVVIAITGVEKALLQKMLPDKQVITTGYAMPFTGQPAEKDTHDFLFLASSNPFNRDGAATFIREVLPRIRAASPDSRLLLAGQVCSRLKSDGAPELLTAPGVVPLGLVDDVASLYQSAAFVINPVRFGTGLKIKTVEALAAGKPVVATATGCEGLPRGKNLPFIEADDHTGFAAACIQLLSDPRARQQRARYAAAYAKKHFSMAGVYRELQKTLARRRGATRRQAPPLPPTTMHRGSVTRLLKQMFRGQELRVLEVGDPLRGMIPDLARAIGIVRYDNLPPILTMEELDFHSLKAGALPTVFRGIQNAAFHRMPPAQFLATTQPHAAYNLLYVHGEPRWEPLLRTLLSFAPSLENNGILAVEGYGDLDRVAITRAVDNFIWLAMPELTKIVCVPSTPVADWPLPQKAGGYTILLQYKARIKQPAEFDGSMFQAEAAAAPPSEAAPAPFAARCLQLLVQERLKAWVARNIRRLAVFGAGAHTQWLETTCQGLGYEIVAVLDDHPQGKDMRFGLPVTAAASFNPATADAILLSSDCRQRELAHRCRELYGAGVVLLDLYEGLPPGPYAK